MSWEKEYEHMRDYGHTWGPGIDDYEEPSPEEYKRLKEEHTEREKKLAAMRVKPRKKYVLAAKELEKTLPNNRDITYGKAPWNWRDEYSSAKMNLCKQAAKDLGYTFGPRIRKEEDHSSLIIKVEATKGAQVYEYAATDIHSIEDCLQLVADFHAIGCLTTTYYKDHFISENDTAFLRIHLNNWDVDFSKLDEEYQNYVEEVIAFDAQLTIGKVISKNEFYYGVYKCGFKLEEVLEELDFRANMTDGALEGNYIYDKFRKISYTELEVIEKILEGKNKELNNKMQKAINKCEEQHKDNRQDLQLEEGVKDLCID